MLFCAARRYLAILCLSGILVSCTSANVGMHRETVPSPRPEIEISDKNTGTIRSIDIDLSVRHISNTEWKIISSQSVFGFDEQITKANPSCEIFLLIIKNTSTQPVYDLSFEIKAPPDIYQSYTLKELKKIFSVKSGEIEKIQPFFSYRRLHTNNVDIEKIDFDRNSTGYPFGVILPHDTISIFSAFPFAGVEVRKYRISAKYSVSGIKKNVDFEVTRNEYRQDDPRSANSSNGDKKWR